MGVRCTLLGHAYGAAEVEREREESGDEAVVTIREVKTCKRCGNRSVVTENKEVTSVEPPAEGPPAGGEPEPTGVPDPSPDAPAPEGPEHDPETDDGVILEEDEDEEDEAPGERGYGEWPDADEDHASAEADPAAGADAEPAEWPDAEGDDEGYEADAPTGETSDVEYPQGRPNAPGDEPGAGGGSAAGTGAEADAGAGAETGAGGGADGGGEEGSDPGASGPAPGAASDMARAREATPPAGPTSPGTELQCPACGYRDPSRDGSLREGDICPECKQGYLAAHE